MSARATIAVGRRRQRIRTYVWITALAAVTISLIYWEQTAILYILATLGVTALLVVVAQSDLRGAETSPGDLTAAAEPGANAASTASFQNRPASFGKRKSG